MNSTPTLLEIGIIIAAACHPTAYIAVAIALAFTVAVRLIEYRATRRPSAAA